ncbi:PAS domain-containing sensor histidine kinase [Bacteroidota bacterium]
MNRTNRELASFLISLKEKNTSVAFSKKNIDKTFKGLRQSFEIINEELKAVKLTNALKEQFLNIIVENAGAGLLAFNKSGKILIFNNSAQKLLNRPHAENLNELNKTNPDFHKIVMAIKPGQQELVIEKLSNGFKRNFSVRSTKLKTENDLISIITFHNINKELEDKEMDSWKDLTRVITHEIMNSLTTIPTLTATIDDCLSMVVSSGNNKNQEITDALSCSKLVEERANSLIGFAERFRNLNKIPQLNITKVNIKELFDNIPKLIKVEPNINFKIDVKPDNLVLFADEKLLDQVIINLVKNSIDAIEDKIDGQITLRAFMNMDNKIIIQIIDNGSGIPPDIIDRIFIPFYSSKKEGSGIGLSFTRQIIREHKGSITVNSVPDKETVFTIEI